MNEQELREAIRILRVIPFKCLEGTALELQTQALKQIQALQILLDLAQSYLDISDKELIPNKKELEEKEV